jgi:hypothetical protein
MTFLLFNSDDATGRTRLRDLGLSNAYTILMTAGGIFATGVSVSKTGHGMETDLAGGRQSPKKPPGSSWAGGWLR